MRVLHVNHSDISGGAARAAYRLHRALCKEGVDSKMLVSRALSKDPTILGPPNRAALLYDQICGRIGASISKTLYIKNRALHSPAIVPSLLIHRINRSDADVINLHWINGEILSIQDIGKITKPVVWTFHDMWAFCGAEHYTENLRWFEGYSKNNRPENERGFDLNRWTWERKVKYWKNTMQTITPSHWLADCAQKSVLMKNWPIHVIPNTIDTELWAPKEKLIARKKIELPESDKKLILFGAIGGKQDPRKGFDLLRAALKFLNQDQYALEIIIFGQERPKAPEELGFPIHYSGHISNDSDLCNLYNAADVIIIPSRQDNLPNTGLEAQASGVPVIAFDVGGMSDIIDHKKTGYLAKPFDPASLAEGIKWVLENKERQVMLSNNARDHAKKIWSNDAVIPQYKKIYELAINTYNTRKFKT